MIFQNMDLNNHAFDVAAAKAFLDHKDFIRDVICFHIQDQDQADDLFQDFFLSLVSNPVPTGVQNIESYLYKAIVNDIIDAAHRKKHYRNCMRECAEHSHRPYDQQTPVGAIVEKEEASGVFDLIEKRLPRTEAQAVYLQYHDGREAKEIAEEMGVAVATARGYVSDGLNRIRRLLNVRAGPTVPH